MTVCISKLSFMHLSMVGLRMVMSMGLIGKFAQVCGIQQGNFIFDVETHKQFDI